MSIWPFFSRGRRDRELDEEIRAHLAMAARDRIERGEDPRAAEAAARREFGNRTLVEETTREMWGWSSFENLLRDICYAVRGLRHRPGSSARQCWSPLLLSRSFSVGCFGEAKRRVVNKGAPHS